MSPMDVEVTHEEFCRVASSSSMSGDGVKPMRIFSSRINSLFTKQRSNRSVYSDIAITDGAGSVTGLTTVGGESVSAKTLASVDTVKVSNRRFKHISEQSRPHDTKKNPWHKIKKMIGSKKDGEGDCDVTALSTRSRSLSSGSTVPSRDAYPMRKRVESEGRRRPRAGLDEAIRGRLDGMDVLSLGSARRGSVPCTPDPLTLNATLLRSKDMISDMLRTSSGRDPPEIVFEGYIPNDRWLVRLESLETSNNAVPQLQSTDDESSSDGSPTMPTPKLLAAIWGRGRTPPPSHTTVELDDDVFSMAASCSVPIDLDEGIFIVDTPQHLQVVHDIAAAKLKMGRFSDALDIFTKILKGLEMRHGDEPHHLIGSALHNIGIIQLWQGNFQEAWTSFNQAVSVRMQALGSEHPDVAVSLAKEAMACFALEKWADALHVFEKALKMAYADNTTRAKILNNIGVVHYQRREHMKAMKSFTSALEIQRIWLDGKVRRDSIVFDAATTMTNMGKLYLEQENYPLTFFVYEEALLLQKTAFPKDHDIVLRSLDSLAYARARQGNSEKAIQLYQSILRSQYARFGPNSKEAMETTMLIAILSTRTGRSDEALRYFTTVLKWQKAHLSSNDLKLLQTKEYVKRLESDVADEEVSEWV